MQSCLNKDVLLIRHAESLWNVGKSDSLDSGLSENGSSQAETLATYLSKYASEFKNQYRLFTSPYLRCLMTARPISRISENKFVINTDVAELTDHYPDKGVIVPERKEDFREMYWGNYMPTWFVKEPQSSFLARVHRFVDCLPEKAIIITHGSIVQTVIEILIKSYAHSIPIWDHSIKNGMVSRIKNGKLIWFNNEIML